MFKPLINITLVIAACAATGCAGNKSANALLGDLQSTSADVRTDIEKLAERDELLVALAKQYASAIAATPETGSNICAFRHAEAKAELYSVRADIAGEIVRGSAAESRSINPTLDRKAEDAELFTRLNELHAESQRLDAAAQAAQSDLALQLQSKAAMAKYLAYSANVLLAVSEASFGASTAIANTSASMLQRLDATVQQKSDELDAALQRCLSDQSGATARLTVGDNIDALTTTDAYGYLSEYLSVVEKSSSTLQRQRNFTRTAFQLAVENLTGGLAEGAFKLNNAKGLDTGELGQGFRDFLDTVTDNGAAIEDVKNTISIDSIKRAANLSGIGSALSDAMAAEVDKMLNVTSKQEAETQAEQKAAEMINADNGSSQ